MTSRRQLLQASLTLGALQLFPGMSHAQAKRLVFATFTGSWEEAARRTDYARGNIPLIIGTER